MKLTRKEFFRQGILSLGKAALDIADTLKPPREMAIPDLPEGGLPTPESYPYRVACPDNQRCLGRNCGCFACVERCESQAILLLPGVGIRVDESRCSGCGICEYVCPVVPKAVKLRHRHDEVKALEGGSK